MITEEKIRSINLAAKATKILAIGSWTEKAKDNAARVRVMTMEVPATVRLYLDGVIEHWWMKPDASGVVFVLNFTDKKKAHQVLEALPLGVAGMMEFEYVEMAPLMPLSFLLD